MGDEIEREEGCVESMLMWSMVSAILGALVIILAFSFGIWIGMRVGSGGAKSAFGVVRGDSYQGAEDVDGKPEEVGGKSLRQTGVEYADAMNAVDVQVKRFLDSTVFGGGPRRARSVEVEDD